MSSAAPVNFSSRNTITQKKGDSYYARSRARSTHSNRKNMKMNLRSRSVDMFNLFDEEKILNVESDHNIFLNVSETFKNILSQLEIVDNDEVYKKLLEIQNLIDNKISLLKHRVAEENSSSQNGSPTKDLTVSRSSSSVEILIIEESFPENCLDNISLFKEFLIKVNCPFCLDIQADKNNLIKHLNERCRADKNKMFLKNKHMLFSVFQILPNNVFKCNVCRNSVQESIRAYFIHLHTKRHLENCAKAAQSKVYSEYLFCSCCKIQVANNYTQIDFHIKHEVHKIRSENAPHSENFLQKGIHCVYIKSKKFKCLDCPSQSTCDTPKEILKHFEKPKHIKNIKKNANYISMVYCEFCCQTVHFFEIINHFNEAKHKMQVEKVKENEKSFELCFYCGFVCDDLAALFLHMEYRCVVINEIRKNLRLTEFEEKKSQNHKAADIHNPRDDAKEEYYILVKDNVEIPKLLQYFKKFGEVIAVEMYENDIKIKFQEKKAVEDIFLLRNVLKIDGVKLEIKIDESLKKSENTINRTKSLDRNNDIDISHIVDQDDKSKTETSGAVEEAFGLQNLFERVSSHLAHNAQKLETELHKKITEDCVRTLQVQSCDFVGFLGCRLSFPVETVSLYCDNKNNISMNPTSSEKIDTSTKHLVQMHYVKMCNSELWKNVIVFFDSPFPYIKCEHRETQKACTVTFAQSAMMLTDMLRDCLICNDVAQSFCLMVRFWLSVHELEIRRFEYTIISILVFFLINKKIVNFPFHRYEVREMESFNQFIKDKLGFSEPLSTSLVFRLDVKELFEKFLLFLDSFDFDKYSICLPVQHPVPKVLLENYKMKFLKVSETDQLVKSPMCIVDPILFRNLAMNVSEKDKNSLLKIVRSTIQHYKIQ